MNENAIGVFDSGIGGAALVNELNILIPTEKVIFLADSFGRFDIKNDKDAVLEYTAKCISFFENRNVKLILSADSIVNTVLGNKLPDTLTEYSGIFVPAVQAACGVTRSSRIIVAGSENTIKCGGYARIIKNIKQGTAVTGLVCPFISDSGKILSDKIQLEGDIADIFSNISDEKYDTVILADGYREDYKYAVQNVLGEAVNVISPYEEAARYAYNSLLEDDMLSENKNIPDNNIFISERCISIRESLSNILKRSADISVL